MRICFILLILFGAFTACKKEKPDLAGPFYHCNQSQNLDSASIAAKLSGSWIWSKRYAFGMNRIESADKNVKVTFNTNQTFVVYENGIATIQGNWKLVLVDSPSWGLILTSFSEYLHGRILFCGNQVLFNDSYVDGYDNLFDRSN